MKTEQTEKPRYKHDCEMCDYLGQFEEFDLYYCLQGNNFPTVSARYGDKKLNNAYKPL